MPWSGGSFTRTNGVHTGSTLWVQDRDAGTKILATRHDTHDQDLADGINLTLEKSGSNAATGNLDIGSNRITLVADGTATQDVATINQLQSNAPAFQASDTGTANAYVIALSPAVAAYAAGQAFTFKAANASTTASTLNVNTIGTKAIKKLNDQDIASGDIESGSIVTVVYDGTSFQMTSQTASAGGQPLNANLTDIAAITQVDGDIIMSDGTDYKAVPNVSGAKNILINGSMRIAQRSTSETGLGATTGYFTLDRWRLSAGSAPPARWTVTQVTLTPSTDGPTADGHRFSMKLDCTTSDASPATADTLELMQRIEGFNLQRLNYGDADAKTVVCAFWHKHTKTGTHIVGFQAGSQWSAKAYTQSVTNTWEKSTVTFAGDTSNSIAASAASALALTFGVYAGATWTSGSVGDWQTGNGNILPGQVNNADNTANNFEIAGVQLEVANASTPLDTPFEHKTYGDELFACQRYFLRDVIAAAGMAWMIGQAESTTLTYGVYSYPTTMRAAPTLGTTGTATDYRLRQSGSNVTCSAVPALTEASTVNNMQITFTVASGLTADAPARMQGLDTAAYLEFSAEL
jgi:hypothetical protein